MARVRGCNAVPPCGRQQLTLHGVHLTHALHSPLSMASPGLASQDAAAGLANLRATEQASPGLRPTVLESLKDVLALAEFSVNSKAWRLVRAAGIRMRPSMPVRGAPAA